MSDARQHEIDRLRIAGLERELDEAHERIRQLEALRRSSRRWSAARES